MTAVVRNSVLNPLATCFVPSNPRAFCRDKTKGTRKTVTPEVKAETYSNDSKTTRLNYPLTTTDHAYKYPGDRKCCEELKGEEFKKHFNESAAMVLFRVPSFVPEILPKLMPSEPVFLEKQTFGISSLILLAVVKLIYNETYQAESCVEISEVAEFEYEIDEECLCPPMFGWVIPPTFFGNPLNLRYGCNKNYVHSPNYLGGLKRTCIQTNQSLKHCEKENSTLHLSEQRETLEQCSLEFQMIIRDVCNSVRDEEIEVDELEKTLWNDTLDSKDSDDEQIVDDESHPLLLPSNISAEEDHQSIEVVENILEKCLLPVKESQPFAIETQTANAACIPPCSYWCENLPPAARETYKRFQTSQRHMESKFDSNSLNSVERRFLYKRSFSAGDAPMYETSGSGVISLASEEESRERSLLRKSPVSCLTNYALSDKRLYRYSHSDLSDCQLKDGHETTWGLFDGADSLWKPLPDCTPSNDCNQKPSHKKAREVRRLRSMN